MISVFVAIALEGASVVVPLELTPDSPLWVQAPQGRQLQRLLEGVRPDILADGRRIEAVITCRVKADGFLEACVIASENPARSGLGRAALRLMPKFQLKATSMESPAIEGGQIRIPFRAAPPGLR